QRGREFLAFRAMTRIGVRFQGGNKGPSAMEIAEALGVPLRLVGQILNLLIKANLLAEVTGPEPAFLPARPLRQITAYDILNALRNGQALELGPSSDSMRAVLREEIARIEQAERDAASAVTLEDLVDHAAGAMSSGP